MQLPIANNRKDMINTFLLVLGYGLFLYCFQLFLSKCGIATAQPNEETLLRWDAGIYQNISRIGYVYPDKIANNTGCYILFPWVWRLLHASVMGICIANLIFFAIGFTLISTIYPVSTKEKFLWLTTPSLYFMFVPYTEALFCVLTALAFYGIFTKKYWLIWVSLFLVSLTRATAVFLIPSLLIMELLTNDKKDILKVFGHYLIRYAAPTLAGQAVFVLVQYYDTGVWFAYYKQQVTSLGHKFAWPILPFSNFYGAQRITWLSALAMLVCFVALIMIFIKFFEWLFKNKIFADKLLILTLAYLPVILFTMVFCNPTWGSNTTNLLGLHRYAFCTPFIFIFLYHFASNAREYKPKHFIIMFILCNIAWASMGAFVHIQHLLFYNFNTLLIFGYMLHANKKTGWATLAMIAINVFFQVTLFQQYLNGLFTD